MATPCIHCGVLLPPGARLCDRCGAPVPPSWSDPRRVPEPPPFDAPQGWVEHRDAWRGFRVWHPGGFRVLRTEGPILVTPDRGRRYAALFWPLALRDPDEARALPARFVQWRRQANPAARAFMAPPGPSGEILLRVTEDGPQGLLETQVQVRTEGRSALLLGVLAPGGCPVANLDALVRIGASFAPIPALPRQLWVDPTEGAFAVEVPVGWAARGGISRQDAPGLGTSFFEAWGDATGSVRVRLSGETFQFVDPGPGGGLAGLLGGMPPMAMLLPPGMSAPYQAAEAFVRERLLAERRRVDPGAALLTGEDREDLARVTLAELARRGMPGARVSAGEYLLRFRPAGAPVLERGRVQTLMVPVPSLLPAPQPWLAEVPRVLQAPEAEFASLEPVLEGVAASSRPNPRWQAQEQAALQGHLAASQADRNRRLGEISRTLSETSDLVTGGYWQRQATTDHLSRDWSNAILGYEDRVSSTGEVFNVPAGHDRVFRDPQGNLYGGGWLVNPDPTWQELRLE